jgi:hypothetical protein
VAAVAATECRRWGCFDEFSRIANRRNVVAARLAKKNPRHSADAYPDPHFRCRLFVGFFVIALSVRSMWLAASGYGPALDHALRVNRVP